MSDTPVQTKITLAPAHLLDIDSIRPYWRNPRRIPEEAVAGLMTSIRKFGYNQPIVVDTSGVIIIGHTRYAAMRRMGFEKIPVQVADTLTAAQTKELRLIDNRSGEFSSWDFDQLTGEVSELAELDRELMEQFFPELLAVELATKDPTELLDTSGDTVTSTVDFVCPSCFHLWTAQITRSDLMSGRIRAESALPEPAVAPEAPVSPSSPTTAPASPDTAPLGEQA